MKVYYTLIFIIIAFQLQAQNTLKLSVGDSLPSKQFPVKNYHKDTINLDDYKDKLIIIDIWDVTCAGCIVGMPKLQDLQEKFKDQIKIILLSDDSWEAIEKLKTRSDILKNTKLPMIVGNSNLAPQLNYVYLPTYVWLKDGKIITHITESKVINEKSIKEFLSNSKLEIENKKEIKVTPKEPLLPQLYPHIKTNYLFYSFLAKLDYRILRGVSIARDYAQPENPITSIRVVGNNIKALYQASYGDHFKNKSFRRTIFDDVKLDSLDSIEYAFELQVNQPKTDNEVLGLMRQQLDLNLGLTSKMEKRLQKVYVLKRSDGIPLNKLTAEKPHILKGISSKDSRSILAFKDVMWVMVTMALNQGEIVPPFEIIDETEIEIETVVNFDMPQNLSLQNLNTVNRKLAEVGLEIEFTERPLDVIVIYKH